MNYELQPNGTVAVRLPELPFAASTGGVRARSARAVVELWRLNGEAPSCCRDEGVLTKEKDRNGWLERHVQGGR